jgi:tRNA-splicing ligase RtcB
VLIPGTMGTSSFVLVGTERGMETAFGTSCHGAGRRISRSKAKKEVRGSQLRQELQKRGIIIRSESDPGLAEEAPLAYKDVDDVVNVVDTTGLARKVARVKPLAVIKGD